MQQLLAILLVALLGVNSFPLAAPVRLICRVSGQAMQPIAVEDDPKSCCAVQQAPFGELELVNPSCCEIKTTPGHTPLPDTTLPHFDTTVAVLPTTPLFVPIPVLFEVVSLVIYAGMPQYRGPPPSSASPRAPPPLS